MDALTERLAVRTRPGTRERLRLLAALKRKPMGLALAELVEGELAKELAKDGKKQK